MQTTVTTILDLHSKVSTMGTHVLNGLFQGKTGSVNCDLTTENGVKYQISVTSKRLYSKKTTKKSATTTKKKVTRKKTTKKVTRKKATRARKK